jgi:hypothetical protein
MIRLGIMLYQDARKCADQAIAFPDDSSSRAQFHLETQRQAIFDSENHRTFWDQFCFVRISAAKVRQ